MSVYDPRAAMDWEAVFGVLVECCGANEEQREEFLAYMTLHTGSSEWRFGGWFGFGGKLYVNGQGVYVDCYAEQRSPIVAFAIKVANERIQTLLKSDGYDPAQAQAAMKAISRLKFWVESLEREASLEHRDNDELCQVEGRLLHNLQQAIRRVLALEKDGWLLLKRDSELQHKRLPGGDIYIKRGAEHEAFSLATGEAAEKFDERDDEMSWVWMSAKLFFARLFQAVAALPEGITEEQVRRALRKAAEKCDLPFAARVGDYSDLEIREGSLRRADQRADAQNAGWMREVLTAALEGPAVPPTTPQEDA